MRQRVEAGDRSCVHCAPSRPGLRDDLSPVGEAGDAAVGAEHQQRSVALCAGRSEPSLQLHRSRARGLHLQGRAWVSCIKKAMSEAGLPPIASLPHVGSVLCLDPATHLEEGRCRRHVACIREPAVARAHLSSSWWTDASTRPDSTRGGAADAADSK